MHVVIRFILSVFLEWYSLCACVFERVLWVIQRLFFCFFDIVLGVTPGPRGLIVAREPFARLVNYFFSPVWA